MDASERKWQMWKLLSTISTLTIAGLRCNLCDITWSEMHVTWIRLHVLLFKDSSKLGGDMDQGYIFVDPKNSVMEDINVWCLYALNTSPDASYECITVREGSLVQTITEPRHKNTHASTNASASTNEKKWQLQKRKTWCDSTAFRVWHAVARFSVLGCINWSKL